MKGNGKILASVVIMGVAAMMMLSIMPAMAQPIGDPVSDVPLTDSHLPDICNLIKAKLAAAGAPSAALKAILASVCS